MGGWKAVLNLGGKAVNFGGRTLKYGLHNPKTALGGLGTGVVAWKYFFNDQSLIEQATDVALGDDAAKGLKDGGVVGGLKSAVFGTDGAQRSIGENIVDGVVGDGTFHQIGQTAGNMIDSAGNVIHSAGQGVQQMFNGNNQITQMQGGGMQMPFNGIGQLVNSFWNGGSSVRQFRLDGKDCILVPWCIGHAEYAAACTTVVAPTVGLFTGSVPASVGTGSDAAGDGGGRE